MVRYLLFYVNQSEKEEEGRRGGILQEKMVERGRFVENPREFLVGSDRVLRGIGNSNIQHTGVKRTGPRREIPNVIARLSCPLFVDTRETAVPVRGEAAGNRGGISWIFIVKRGKGWYTTMLKC